jgi:hypothetical protein
MAEFCKLCIGKVNKNSNQWGLTAYIAITLDIDRDRMSLITELVL